MSSEAISQAIVEALASSPWEQLEAACNRHAERVKLAAFLTSSLPSSSPLPSFPAAASSSVILDEERETIELAGPDSSSFEIVDPSSAEIIG